MSTGSLFPGVAPLRSCAEQYRRRLQARILRHGLYRGYVHADDILAGLPIPENVHPNTVGLAFSGLAELCLIEQVGFQRSERRTRHRGVSRLWRVCDTKGARQYLKARMNDEQEITV